MHFGVSIFPTAYTIQPDALARELEQRGFESLWFTEHTHIPASRRTAWGGGSNLPKEYWHTYDPFVALTAAAMATTRLRIGTGICLLVERDPIVTAKQIASLDSLSNGRFTFGIGGGWNAEEMENHGTDFKKRWRVLRERVLAMKEIWTRDEARFHGEFVNFDKIWSYPKPIQKPHPPILMGGEGPTTFDRVIEFCDGWMPGPGTFNRFDEPANGWVYLGDPSPNRREKIAALRSRAELAGRDPRSINVTIYGGFPNQRSIDELEAAGVDRVIFIMPPVDQEGALPLLDGCASIVKRG
jgi:probable F420-dependent oxidoreductase